MFWKKNKKTVVEKFRDPENELITFQELSKIPLNETTQLYKKLPGAVEFTRITSNNNNLMFTVSMKKGQLWERHSHDCDEILLLFKGRLKRILKNKKIEIGLPYTINAYENHYVLAEEDSIFYVEFKNPLK